MGKENGKVCRNYYDMLENGTRLGYFAIAGEAGEDFAVMTVIARDKAEAIKYFEVRFSEYQHVMAYVMTDYMAKLLMVKNDGYEQTYTQSGG